MADASLTDKPTWVCRKCGSTERRSDGTGCGPCWREYGKKYRARRRALPDEERQKLRDRRTAKRKQRFAEDPAYYEQCLKKDREAQKRLREREGDEGATRRAERAREWLQRMKEEEPERYAEWRRQRATYMRNRIHSSDKLILRNRISTLVSLRLKRGSKGRASWVDLLGYTVEALAKRLKRTIPKGCTWDDFIAGRLHIDHIIPVTAFNFSTPQCFDFKRCYALKNLRLLPARDNIRKGNKLDRPFQPALL